MCAHSNQPNLNCIPVELIPFRSTHATPIHARRIPHILIHHPLDAGAARDGGARARGDGAAARGRAGRALPQALHPVLPPVRPTMP